MRMYFDESGTFEAGRARSDVAIVTGVAVPATDQPRLFAEFGRLKVSEIGCASASEEVKGHRLTTNQRRLICRLLDQFPRVLVRPVIVDLHDFYGAQMQVLRDELGRSFEEVAFELPPGEARREVGLLRSLHLRMSNSQLARLFAWANCIDRTLRDAAMELVPEHERTSWSGLELLVDGPTANLATPEGRFFIPMLQNWLVTWSYENRFPALEVAGKQHPLLEHFHHAMGLNIRTLVERGLHFVDSATEPGIQLADIAATIVGSASRLKDTDPDGLKTYGWLMKRSSERNRFGIGLLTAQRAQADKPDTVFTPLRREYDDAQVRRQIPLGGSFWV
jgi:hypothetical protein